MRHSATHAHRVMGKQLPHKTITLSFTCFVQSLIGWVFFRSDSSPQMCLNEYHLILLLAGAFVGFSYSLLGVIHNMNYISFHTVQVCEDAKTEYFF